MYFNNVESTYYNYNFSAILVKNNNNSPSYDILKYGYPTSIFQPTYLTAERLRPLVEVYIKQVFMKVVMVDLYQPNQLVNQIT